MDSLVANYASSEEEDEEVAAVETHKITAQPSTSSKPSSSLFATLPQPQNQSQLQVQPQSQTRPSSSLFSSLPKPKQQQDVPIYEDDDYLKEKPTSSILFSSLPQPQTQTSSQPVSNNPKKVILFSPPLPSKPINDDDDDDEEEEEQPKRVMGSGSVPQSSSVKSFLSSIPAPKHSTMALGSGSAFSGSRKSILQTETTPSTTPSDSEGLHAQNNDGLTIGNQRSSCYDPPPDSVSFGDPTAGAYYAHYSVSDYPAPESGSNHNATTDGYSDFSYHSYQSSAGFVNYGDYGNTFADGNVAATVPETSTAITEDAIPWRVPSEKRRRNGMMPPAEIVEVSQDDLTKNRPREDQAKLTGIAFGPAYHQPASSKGKPSKLHKRKHQIGSLYFDMKQKETELAERRAKGFLTKAQTQGKYGW